MALWDRALSQQINLGDQDFVGRMQAKLEPAKVQAKEIPRQQRRASVQPLQLYLANTADRDASILAAVQEGGYSLTAIAGALGLSVSRVSRIVRRDSGR